VEQGNCKKIEPKNTDRKRVGAGCGGNMEQGKNHCSDGSKNVPPEFFGLENPEEDRAS
jgi:hypothetical protein